MNKIINKDKYVSEHASIACTPQQYAEIIRILWEGTDIIRKNHAIGTILQFEANSGLRIGDILKLRLDDILYDNGRYRFCIIESKTNKRRTFTIPNQIYKMLESYAKYNEIPHDTLLFKMTVRNVQKKLATIVDYLGYDHISTHSFRKYFATQCYINSKYDIEVVRRILQHSNSSVTLRYICTSDAKIERTLQKTVNIIATEEKGIKDISYESTATLPPIGQKVYDEFSNVCKHQNLSIKEGIALALQSYITEFKNANSFI